MKFSSQNWYDGPKDSREDALLDYTWLSSNNFCFCLFTVDDCPQRFNDGSDPYKTELQIYVLGGASTVQLSLITIVTTAVIILIS